MKFRKKPVEIEAFQFTGGSNTDPSVPAWFVDAVLSGTVVASSDHIAIKTLEGVMRGEIGDWIIRGVKGEIYPCKPDVFAATYEAVNGSSPLAIEDVATERRRQVEQEGWTPQHDDREHEQGALACAGAAYALHAGHVVNPNRAGYFSPPPDFWPFDEEWWKPKNPRRDLVRAAALIIAEIERLDRKG